MLASEEPNMCYDIIVCPRCGEWLDELAWDKHMCRMPQDEPVAKNSKSKEKQRERQLNPEIIVRAQD